MARFWKVFADSANPTAHGGSTPKWRYINIYDIDEITDAPPRPELDDKQKRTGKMIPRVEVHMHSGPLAFDPSVNRVLYARHEFTTDGKLDDIAAKLEKMLLEDRMLATAPHEHDDEDDETPPARTVTVKLDVRGDHGPVVTVGKSASPLQKGVVLSLTDAEIASGVTLGTVKQGNAPGSTKVLKVINDHPSKVVQIGTGYTIYPGTSRIFYEVDMQEAHKLTFKAST